MFPIPPFLFKIGGIVVLLGGLVIAWNLHGKSEYNRGRDELRDVITASLKETEAANRALSKARDDLLTQSKARDSVEEAKLEKIRESIRLLDDDRSATISRLRATAARYPSESRPTPGSACEAEILRFQACGSLLAEGQALAIRGADLLNRSGKMVSDGEILAREQALILELGKDWAQAIELGVK